MSDSGQELVVIPDGIALSIFTDKSKIEPYIEKVRSVVSGFSGSVETVKGRKEIASMAFKVAKVKTYIEGIGKDLAAEQKEIPRKIDATRKYARDTEARLKREADAKAAQEERDRLAREADTKLRTAVNRAALAALVEGGIDEDVGKKVIALIAKKMIPAITIQY